MMTRSLATILQDMPRKSFEPGPLQPPIVGGGPRTTYFDVDPRPLETLPGARQNVVVTTARAPTSSSATPDSSR